MIASTSTIVIASSQFNAINASLHGVVAALQNQSFWNTQLFAAIIGAALGLLPFLYLVYQDRPRIKVRINTVLVADTARPRTGFSINVANFGRRAITLERVFLRFADGESLVFMSNTNFVGGSSGLPKTLREGTSHSVVILTGTVAEPILKKAHPVAACYADALGEVYTAKTNKEFWETLFKVAAKD
jgi:hypothetical protein